MSTGVFLFSSVCITSFKTFNSENKSKPSISMEFLYVRALSRQRHLSCKLSSSNDFNFSKLIENQKVFHIYETVQTFAQLRKQLDQL